MNNGSKNKTVASGYKEQRMNRNKIKLSLLLASIFIFSCHNSNKDRAETASSVQSRSTSVQFEKFISKFKMLSYPFAANTDCYEPDTLTSVALDMDNDSTFINYVGPGVAVGMLPDTSHFYAVIYCTAAECYMPNLAVFSKTGQMLSKHEIAYGCGFGAGYVCSENLKINSLNDILLIHKEEEYNLNKGGKEIKGTGTRTIKTYKYSITQNGVINFTADTVKNALRNTGNE
jgi:hypothetical protein